MSITPFRVTGIVWPDSNQTFPAEAIVDVPSWLTDLGPEDCEPANDNEDAALSGACEPDDLDADQDDDFDEDDDELDEDYQPSEAAWDALDAEWDRAIFDLLARSYGEMPVSIGSYGPA